MASGKGAGPRRSARSTTGKRAASPADPPSDPPSDPTSLGDEYKNSDASEEYDPPEEFEQPESTPPDEHIESTQASSSSEPSHSSQQEPPKKKRRIVPSKPSRQKVGPPTYIATNQSVPSKYALEDHGVPDDMPAASLTKFLNHVAQYGVDVNTQCSQKYELAPTGLQDIESLEDYDGRNFKVKSIFKDTIRRDASGSRIEVWNLTCHDVNRPSGKRTALHMFSIDLSREVVGNNSFHNCALETSIFTKDMVNTLGLYACRILNKVPFPLQEQSWSRSASGRNGSRVRQFVESVALARALPDLDPTVLNVEFFDTSLGNRGGLYSRGLGIACYDARGTHQYSFDNRHMSMVLERLDDGNAKSSTSFEHINNIASLDEEAINNKVPDKSHTPWNGIVNNSSGHSRFDSAIRLSRAMRSELLGKSGSTKAIRAAMEDFQIPFRTDSRQPTGRLTSGMNGKRILGVTRPLTQQRGVRMDLIDVGFRLKQSPIEDLTPLSDANLSRYLSIVCLTYDRIHHAWIREVVHRKLKDDRGYLNAVQAGHVAAALSNAGQVSNKQILQSGFCIDPDHPDTHDHPCMGTCGRVLRCQDLGPDEDGRFLCEICHGRPIDPQLKRRNLVAFTRNLLSYALREDRRNGFDTVSLDEAFDHFQTFFLDDDRWENAYTGKAMSHSAAVWTEGPMQSIYSSLNSLSHPLQISVEKIFGLWVKSDGKTGAHIPENTAPVTWADNLLHGNRSIGLMPYKGLMLRLADKVKDLDPCSGYHPEVRAEFECVEAASDNALMVQANVPYARSARVGSMSAAEFEKHVQADRATLWDGKKPRTNPFKLRADTRLYQNRPLEEHWTPDVVKKLKKFSMDIEVSPKYNPRGLKMERAADGSPWPFIPHHRPDDLDWQWWEYEAHVRLWTWRELCNRNHPTSESTITIILIILIEWYRTGGKCRLFKCRLTPYNGHALSYSIGRALCITDEAGNFVRDVAAGEPMRSGFTTTDITDVAKDFDFTLCTIDVESWAGNSVKHNFPLTIRNIDILTDHLKQLCKSKYWDDIKPISAFRKVHFPKSWKENSRGLGRHISNKGKKAVSDVDSDEDFIVDDEIEALLAENAAPSHQDDVRENAGEGEGTMLDDADSPGDISMTDTRPVFITGRARPSQPHVGASNTADVSSDDDRFEADLVEAKHRSLFDKPRPKEFRRDSPMAFVLDGDIWEIYKLRSDVDETSPMYQHLVKFPGALGMHYAIPMANGTFVDMDDKVVALWNAGLVLTPDSSTIFGEYEQQYDPDVKMTGAVKVSSVLAHLANIKLVKDQALFDSGPGNLHEFTLAYGWVIKATDSEDEQHIAHPDNAGHFIFTQSPDLVRGPIAYWYHNGKVTLQDDTESRDRLADSDITALSVRFHRWLGKAVNYTKLTAKFKTGLLAAWKTCVLQKDEPLLAQTLQRWIKEMQDKDLQKFIAAFASRPAEPSTVKLVTMWKPPSDDFDQHVAEHHPLHHYMIVGGGVFQEEYAYATEEGTFVTEYGKQLGHFYEDDCDVYDEDDNFLGTALT